MSKTQWNALFGDDNRTFFVEWSTGGNWCDCWGNDTQIPPDDEPDHPEELARLLTEHFQNISDLSTLYLSYDTGEDHESDWYGGCEYSEWKQITSKDLRENLVRMGYLEIK